MHYILTCEPNLMCGKMYSICILFLLVFFKVCQAKMIGPGLYHVLQMNKCDGSDEDYTIKADVQRRKYNRTHDGFASKLSFSDTFDDSYGIRVEICKYVDGGCKLYHVMTDDSMIHFMNQYAENNVKQYLLMAGIDPPEFPLPAGEIEVKDYVYDYEELPDYGLYGTYEARNEVLRAGRTVGCLDMTVEFKERADDELDFI